MTVLVVRLRPGVVVAVLLVAAVLQFADTRSLAPQLVRRDTYPEVAAVVGQAKSDGPSGSSSSPLDQL